MNNNIACYIRVSTDKIDQQKSLQQQQTLLENQYKDKNILMYSDTGTGTSFKRKGFKQLMYDAGLNPKVLKDGRLTFEVDSNREPLFNEIVVLSTSRFARNISIIDILRILWNYKMVNVKFLDVQKNSSDMNDMILLQMFFAMAENEVKETSTRTKRGNNTSILKNKIRNNSIFGWDFDKENNKLIINEKEAKVVRFIYNTALENGLKLTAKLTNNSGYRTKKGNLWTESTIKTLITNPKYKGYNVRNKFNNINLFTESRTKYVRKENWIIQKNDRIDPIVSENLWDEVQNALNKRCIAGNKGQNARIYDTRNKIKCPICGSNYVRCVETKLSDNSLKNHYLICGHKKKYTKKYCDSNNITVSILDDYIELQRKNYFKNIQLQIQFKVIKLKNDLKLLDNDYDNIYEIQNKKNQVTELKAKLTLLIDNFTSSSETLREVINKKIMDIENEINNLSNEINTLKSINNDKEKHIRYINNKIKKLTLELNTSENKELTRSEWLEKVDKILIHDKSNLETVYTLE